MRPQKYNLFMATRVQVAFVYNTRLSAGDQAKIKSWKDLLNPEWKGKIAMLDPRRRAAAWTYPPFGTPMRSSVWEKIL